MTLSEKSRHVLVVDDDPDCRLLIAALFSEAGYRVSTAPDGIIAWEELSQGSHDILLLDAHLPGRSGFDICDAVKKDPQLRRLPVIMLTAFASEEARTRAENAGADRFVTKPFRNKALIAMAGQILADQPS